MKRSILFLTVLLCVSLCLGSVPFLYANGSQQLLDPDFSASDTPSGPTPANSTGYGVFTFSLTLPKIENNEYYKIIAEITAVSKYRGVCANYDPGGLPRKEDMLFHADDYPESGKWHYEKWNKVTFSLESDATDRTVPTQLTVRCYDWGGYAKVKLTFKKKTGFFSWETLTDTHSIPIDANQNQIADGWASDATQNYAKDADVESVPTGTLAPGDGWTVYDEYRGLILSNTAAAVTRLSPTAKDVLVCSEQSLASYGTGTFGIPHHNIYTIACDYVNAAFTDIYDYAAGGIHQTDNGQPTGVSITSLLAGRSAARQTISKRRGTTYTLRKS